MTTVWAIKGDTRSLDYSSDDPGSSPNGFRV